MQEITAADLSAWLADPARPQPFLLDVREPWEVEICRLPDSVNLPMNLIPLRQAELPDDRPIVAICHHGVRSYQVALWLEHTGFDTPLSLAGGVDAWSASVDPALPRY